RSSYTTDQRIRTSILIEEKLTPKSFIRTLTPRLRKQYNCMAISSRSLKITFSVISKASKFEEKPVRFNISSNHLKKLSVSNKCAVTLIEIGISCLVLCQY